MSPPSVAYPHTRQRLRVLLHLHARRRAPRHPPSLHQAPTSRPERQGRTQPSRGRRGVLGAAHLRQLRGRRRRAARVGAGIQRRAVLHGAARPNSSGETRGRPRGCRLMRTRLWPVLAPARPQGEGRRASRTRVEEGGGYLPIRRPNHFSPSRSPAHAFHPPSPDWGPLLDDGEQGGLGTRGPSAHPGPPVGPAWAAEVAVYLSSASAFRASSFPTNSAGEATAS